MYNEIFQLSAQAVNKKPHLAELLNRPNGILIYKMGDSNPYSSTGEKWITVTTSDGPIGRS